MEKRTKTFGGVGYILVLASMVLGFMLPGINGIISIAGFVLILLAYLNLAREFSDPDIKSLTIKSIIFGVAAAALIVIAVVTGFAAVFKASASEGAQSAATGLSVGMVLLGIAAYGLLVVSSYFWYKVNELLAAHTKMDMFKTGGLLQFIGTIGSIIIVGGILVLVGYILLTVAFFSAEEVETAQPMPPTG